MASSINNEYNQMLAAVAEVNQLCMEAQGYYQKALQHEDKARRANKGGMIAATIATGGGFEVYTQIKRSKNMKRAIESADVASETLQRAFNLIPRDCLLRQRYPQQMSSIGTTPIPSLHGDNLGGALAVTALAGGTGTIVQDCGKSKKIHRNLRILQACAEICGTQQQLLAALGGTIEADMRRGAEHPSFVVPVATATPVEN